ncbi:uncharacterized protein ISCGN_001613 [Ixodes scapularis]
MILIVIDAYSKWIEATATNHATSDSTIRQLRELFSRFGIPRTVVTDNGTPFTSEEFSQFLKRNHVEHYRTAPYHPESNGLAERAVRTVKDALKKTSGSTLDVKLCRLLLNHRRTPVASGKSPSQLLLGYQIRSRLDTCFPDKRSELTAQGGSQLTPPFFKPGRKIFFRNFGKGPKWLPGIVKSAEGSRMVTIQTNSDLVSRHLDQVRQRHTEDPLGFPEWTDPGAPLTPTTSEGKVPCDGALAERGLDPLPGPNPTDSIPANPSSSKSPSTNQNQPLSTPVPPPRRSTRERKKVQPFQSSF